MNPVDLKLYLVTDSGYYDEKRFLDMVEKACRGGVTLLQLREKNRGGREYLRLAQAVKEITDPAGVPLIIDDRVDVALACGAAGIHVGQTDLPVWAARQLMGPDKIVGATAKTVPQALEAYEQGADYLGVGALFPTETKVNTVLTSIDTLKDIVKAVPIGVVGIGGLDESNVDILTGSGAQGGAVVRAIVKAQDPEQAAHRLPGKAGRHPEIKNPDLVFKTRSGFFYVDKAFCLSTSTGG